MIRCVFFIVFGLLVAVQLFAQPGTSFTPTPDAAQLAKAGEMEKEALAKNDFVLLAEAYYIFGKAYSMVGLRDRGEEYFIKSLRILEPKGDSFELGRLYMRLAESDNRLKRKEAAWMRLQQAKEIFERIGSKNGLMRIHQALGAYFVREKNMEACMLHFEKQRELAAELGDSLGIAESGLFLGPRLIGLKQVERGLTYLHNSVELFEKLNRTGSLVATYVHIGKYYTDTEQYEKAGAAFARAESLYATISSPQVHIYRHLQRNLRGYYVKTRNWEAAHRHLINEIQAATEIEGIVRDSIVYRLHAEFETEKKEALLAAQQNEIRLQQNRNYLLLAVLCLSVVFTGILYRLYRRNRKLSRQNAGLVREQGHRIRNHLQMISNMLQMNSGVLSDPEAKATLAESELRVQSIALLQKGLYSKNSGAEVFLPEYFTLLTDHILEVSGYEQVEKRLEIEAVSLHPDRALPVALILNELVTNACKYAFPGHPSPKLTLKCRQEKSRVYFGVADNGPGFAPSLPGTEQSFGMQLIRIQAEQLYAVYSFQSDPETGGTRFEMEFSA